MQEKIIFILQNSFWGRDVKTSGGDVRFVSIFKKIQDNFHDSSTIFTNKEGFIFDKGYKLNFKFALSPPFFDKLGIYLSYFLRTLWVLFKYFRLPINNYFYSLSDFFPDTIVPFLFKSKKKQWIQVIHHIYLHPKKRQGSYIRNLIAYYSQRLSFLLIKNRADKIIVVSQSVREELLKLGFRDNKIYVSSNGVDIDYSDKIILNDKKYEGIFLSRLNKVKGVLELVTIWRNVVKHMPCAKLGIIGGGNKELINELRINIKENNLEENIDLLGYLENKKAFSLVKSSKVFLHPSHEEGWGIAIAEAMACKVPVISWNLPVFKNVFENYTIQVKENAIDLFSIKVIELLENSEKRIKVANDGYNFIKRYSWDSVAQKELEIINL